jgi:two-component system response regulator RegA
MPPPRYHRGVPDHQPPQRRILIVEDDQTFRELLARALRARGHEVLTAADRASARAVSAGTDAALVDLKLGSDSGLDVTEDLTRANQRIRIVLITSHVNDSLFAEARLRGAAGCLAKPFDADEALSALFG